MPSPFPSFAARVERFWSRGRREGSCLIWTGPKNNAGYGYVKWLHRKHRQVHRLAYELTHGPVPEGQELDHLCRNKVCFEPSHLEAVTHRENIMRSNAVTAVNARKTHCARGHEYSPENTIVYSCGRKCRQCRRINDRQRGPRRSRHVDPDGIATPEHVKKGASIDAWTDPNPVRVGTDARQGIMAAVEASAAD